MNKKLRIVLLSFLLIFITGCSGNYDLKINNDLSIDEKLELSIKNENDAYQKTVDIFEKNNIDKKKYNVSINENDVKIEYNDKFVSIEDYVLNSKVYGLLFDKIEYNKTNNFIDIYTNDNIKLKNSYTQINGTNLTDFYVIQVNITNPYKVIITNAEIVNDKTYTWSITNKDNNKKIQMQFKPNLDVFPIRPVVVGLLIIIVSTILLYRLYRRYKKSQNF